MRKHLRYTSWLTVLVLVLTSCFKDTNCLNLRNNLVNIVFKKQADGREDPLLLNKVTVEGATDGAIVVPTEASSKLSIPLNPAKSSQRMSFTIFDVDTNVEVVKSIVLSYDVRTQFESTDCEPKFAYSNLKIEFSDFRATSISNTTPQGSNTGAPNLTLFYH